MRSTHRVSILSLHYPPEPTGNAPYVGSLARGLSDRNVDVRVVTTHPHYPEWSFRAGSGQWTKRQLVDGVPVTRLRHYLPKRPNGLKRLLYELSFGGRLLFARWGRPEVVLLVSPGLFATALAILRARLSPSRPSVIVWVQDLYSLGITEIGAGNGAVAGVMNWVESRTLRAATGVVVIHSRFAAHVASALGVDPARIHVVRNWTHLQPNPLPQLDAVRDQHGWRADETVVLHAGNMGSKQGLENVVDAARLADAQQLPLRFVFLGDGNQREALQRYARGVTRLQFLDSLAEKDFQGALAAADILLVNEKSGVSGMSVPSKLTSYFTSGRPVIAATDPDGVTAAEVLAAGGGLIVRSGEPQSLVDACVEVRNDPDRAAQYGANGQKYRRDVLGQDAAIDRFAQILNSRAADRHA